jgi:transposase
MMMMSWDQMVHEQSFARIIDAFADALDLSGLGFANAELNPEGRPPFKPADLLKLYLYGYHQNIRSCRKLENACQINIEVIWLMKGMQPHYKTIANFRKDNAKALRQVFRQFVAILKDWKLVSGKHIAVDSFKIRAQNSLKNNFNGKKLDRHFSFIDEKINEYLEALDQEEDPDKAANIRQQIQTQEERWNQYCDIEQELISSGQEQISVTDPDARAVVLHRNIVNVGYNVQAVSDAKFKLVTALDTGTVNDTHSLHGMCLLAAENTGIKPKSVLADKGYHTGSQIEKCEQDKIKTYVSPKASAANITYKVFASTQFKYHPGTDTYRCPADEILRSNGVLYERPSRKAGGETTAFKHYKTAACKTCAIRQQCTNSRNGRVIQRQLNQSAIDRNNNRVKQNPAYYKQRQQIIEHQFGTLKRHWGFNHLLTRGKDKVLSECALIFTIYNLRRSLSILGFKTLLNRKTESKH